MAARKALSFGELMDLYTLFDLNLLTVDPDRQTVVVAPELQATKAAEFHGRPLALPRDKKAAPTLEVLARHHALAVAKSRGGSFGADQQADPG